MAREDELVNAVGYPRGAIGPVGSRHGARVLLDQELAEESRLLAGAGEEGYVVAVAAEDLCRAVGATVAPLQPES